MRKSSNGRRLLLHWIAFAAVAVALALPAAASAAGGFLVAPGSARKIQPCTTATPCDYIWAIEQATNGDVIQFESGEYDYAPKPKTKARELEVRGGVTLEQAPGDATRPLIKQTVAFDECSCATIFLFAGAVMKDLAVDQAAGSLPEGGAGAIAINMSTVVERSILTGVFQGMYVTELIAGEAASGGLRDTLVTAEHGTAINAGEISQVKLENVTAIGHGEAKRPGVALFVGSNSEATTVTATNTILRGDTYDVEVESRKGQPATADLHYSDARPGKELLKGAAAHITDSDHPTHAEPLFMSSTDLREALGSPTIDVGTADIASGEFDLGGQPRIRGAHTDIGAYEFQSLTPLVSTGAAGAVSQTTASLAGAVNAEGVTASWYFNYGPTSAYGLRTASQSLAGTIIAPQAVGASLSGLTPGTTYHYQLLATNAFGTVVGADGSFATLPSPPPVDSALELGRTRFRAASRGASISARRPAIGTSVSYNDSQAATTTLTVLAPVAGVRSAHACVAPPRHRARARRYRRCHRYLARGSVTHVDRVGRNSLRFSGRLKGRRLAPGSYRLSVTPRNSAGTLGATLSVGFTIAP